MARSTVKVQAVSVANPFGEEEAASSEYFGITEESALAVLALTQGSIRSCDINLCENDASFILALHFHST